MAARWSADNVASAAWTSAAVSRSSNSSRLDGASWEYTNDSNERADDTLSAITVNGGANQLQPKDVTVTFRRVAADAFEVRINGFFNVFGARGGSVSTGVVPVEATLQAEWQAAR